MIAGLSVGGELRRFLRTPVGRIALIAIILLPLLSSALYLKGFWNPFGNINKLPVAFVNSDEGSTLNGEPFNAGDQIEASLKEKAADTISFDYVDSQTAIEGVRNGTYYFMVELTPDFSRAVTSVTGEEPHQAVIQTTYNDSNGYLSTLIGQNVMRTLVPVISEQIGTQTVDKVLTGLQSAGTGLIQAADGAGRLADGTAQLQEGLGTAQAGTAKLVEGSATVNDKMAQLAAGTDTLASGTAQLLGGATQLSAGTQQLKDSLAPLGQIPVAQLQEQLRALNNPEATAAAEKLGQVTALLEGVDTLNNGMDQLQAGIVKTNDGAATLASSAHQLHDEGTAVVASGLATLGGGIDQLAAGSDTLNAGAHELAARLGEGTTALPQWTDGQRESIAAIMGDPVTSTASNEAGDDHTFGMGLAPFFMSLGLFLGALACFMLLRPISRRAVAGGLAPLRATFHGLLPAAIIGVLQATVVTMVCVFAVGVTPAHFWMTLGACMLTSVMFMAINQFLVLLLGPGPGRVLAIAFLMLQLISSGGLYPIETEPRFFQIIHPFDPMTYTVNLLRQTIYGNFDHRLPQAIIAIIIITVITFILSSLCTRRDRTWTLKRLHPAIEV
ncbi:MAG: YhgE/Pip domain-containing protein [Corynebacterium sp.]|nr:YhgE/Pip domain-containing protein [Corynebacterium sp.]